METNSSILVEPHNIQAVPLQSKIVPVSIIPELVYPPLNPSAEYNATSGQLYLKVEVYAPTEKLAVSQNFYLNAFGNFNLQFYICGYWNQGAPIRDFQLYELRFLAASTDLPEHVTLADIHEVEFFLWNEDPKTSRGTVTTVIPATH